MTLVHPSLVRAMRDQVRGLVRTYETFSPLDLFSGGEAGDWWDFSDLTRLFQASNGTTAVAANDNPIGYAIGQRDSVTAIQATAASRPLYKTGGYAFFDGTADNLLTNINPSASMSLLFKCKVTSASKAIVGSRTGTTDEAEMLTGGTGLLSATVATSGAASGSVDIRTVLGVYGLVYSAAGLILYRNGTADGTAAAGGTVNTTVPFRIGARNTSGTGTIFADMDLYHALIINRVLTPDEVASLTAHWGTS